MKISYILQLKDFFIVFGVGILIGILYDIMNIPNIIKKRLPIQIAIDFICSIVSCVTFIMLVNIINLGEIRLFLIIGYILGLVSERVTLGKLFAKGYKIVYNYIVSLLNKFAKSRLGKVIFK